MDQTHPPRAMIAAHSRMMTIANSSPWMIPVTSLNFFAPITGTYPAVSAPRHDRNSMLGTIDNKPTTMNSENFVRNAWL